MGTGRVDKFSTLRYAARRKPPVKAITVTGFGPWAKLSVGVTYSIYSKTIGVWISAYLAVGNTRRSLLEDISSLKDIADEFADQDQAGPVTSFCFSSTCPGCHRLELSRLIISKLLEPSLPRLPEFSLSTNQGMQPSTNRQTQLPCDDTTL